jgi:glycosyltransferase involved in cell wall biosynthesis
MLIDAWDPFVGGAQVQVKALLKHFPHHIKVHLFHAPHPNIFVRALWCVWVIPRVLLANRYMPFAIVHAHAFAAGIPAKILSLLLKVPVIYTVHGSHLMDMRATGVRAWLEKFLITQIHYTHQISVTRSFTHYPNVNKNISVINNGVDIQAFDKIKVKKNTKFTLLYVGRDHPTKGLNILRAAFALAKKQYPDIRLQVVTGLTGKKLIKAYKQAHAFVLPSLVEGQPLVLLEAWAVKLPVIATQTAGVAEIATPKEAILIPPGDIKSLHQAILKLLRLSPRQRLSLAAAGYRKARRFTWDKTAAQTASLYEQVVSH